MRRALISRADATDAGTRLCGRSAIRRTLVVLAAAVGLPLLGVAAHSQQDGDSSDIPTAEFQFVRLLYNGVQGCGRGGRGWGRGYGRGRGGSACTDFSSAEYHFMLGLTRLTRIDGAAVEPGGYGARQLSLADDAIFDYPWLYAVEVGHWELDDYETARLREYLLRGGFLMVDDFHGDYEWEVFLASMVRVFPDRPILDIPETDPLMHVLYDLNQRIQIPGMAAIQYGRTWEGGEDGKPPHWRGIYDDDDRLIVAINHNMDLGDAWEHADDPRYPAPMTGLAYRFAVNYVIYAITH